VRSAAGLVACIALAGCAAWSPPSDGPVLTGRIAVQVEAPPGERAQGLNAQFELAGDAHRGSLSLSTPLGTRLGEATWAPGVATLVRAGASRTDYVNLDALTRDLFGEALPLAALFDWLAGRPWPDAPDEPTLPPGARGFRQLGWQVDLARLDDGLIVATRDTVTVRVRLDATTP
jgi:outer membrane lipoprotein LolB